MKLSLAIGVVVLMIVAGVFAYVSDFTVYLGNDPTACNNCHVMDAAYEGWFHSGHKVRAECNDCHVRHDLIPKYIDKTEHGINHVSAFTLGNIPLAIRAKPASRDIIQENCIRCHAESVSEIADGEINSGRYCFDCHRSVAHGDRGVSTLPFQDKNPYR
ncbi:MAG: cytochrome c nitrite reductase small subunit [Chloroflexi bacterium]|nr:cytochrome c nitrite reductase small subunit [Chloroflexota bacterium]